jgi:hypothetical protein
MTTSNITDPITSAIEGMKKLQGEGGRNGEVLAAWQQVASAVQQVQTIIAAGNLNGNLSPNVNNVSDNPISATSIGSASANLASPVSDDVVNSVRFGLSGCVSNVSPISQSPVTVINISGCTFNSTVTEAAVTRAKFNQQECEAGVDVQNSVSNDIVTTWIPFVEQLKKLGFSGSQVIALLRQYNGDCSLVLQTLYEQ